MPTTSAGSVSFDIVANSSGFLRSIELSGKRADGILKKLASNSSISMGDIFSRNTSGAFNRVLRSLSSQTDRAAKRMGETLSSAFQRSARTPKADTLQTDEAAQAYKELQKQAQSALSAVRKQEEKTAGLGSAMESATGAAEETKTRIRTLKDEIAALADKTSGREIVPAEEYHRAVARMREAEAELAELEQLFEKQAEAAEKAGDAYLEASSKLKMLREDSDSLQAELASMQRASEPTNGVLEKVSGALSALAAKAKAGASAILNLLKSLMSGFLRLLGGIGLLGAAIAALGTRFTYLSATGDQPISALSGLTAAAETLKSRLATLSAVVQSVVITAFMALAERVVAIASTIVNAISSIFMAIGSFLNTITGGRFSSVLDQVIERQNSLAAASAGAASAAGSQAQAQKELNRTLASFDRINKLSADSSSGGGGGGGGGGGTSATSAALADLGSIGEIELPEKLTAAIKRLTEAVSGFVSIVQGGLQWAWENVLKPLGEWTLNEVAPDAVNFLAEAFENLSKFALDVADPLQRLLILLKNDLMWVYENILRPFGDWFSNKLAPVLLSVLAKLIDIGVTIAEILSPVLKELWEKVLSPIASVVGDALVGAFQTLDDILGNIADALKEFKDSELMQAVLGFIDGAGEKISALIDWCRKLRKTLGSEEANAKGGGGGFSGGGGGGFHGGGGRGGGGGFYFGNSAARSLYGILAKGKASVKLTVKPQGDAKELSEQWSSIDNKDATLVGRVRDMMGLSGEKVKSVWAAVNTKTSQLTAEVSGTSKVAEMGDAISRLKSKTITLDATDDASAKIDNVNKKSLIDHTARLSFDESGVSGRIEAYNKKALNDHTADLKFTPKLTKSNLGMNVKSSMASLYFYANGGYVERNTPRLAVIGDNRYEGEIVSPESKFQTMLDKAAGSGNGDVAALLSQLLDVVSNMDVATYLDGREITRSVVSNINRQVQSTGRSPLLA